MYVKIKMNGKILQHSFLDNITIHQLTPNSRGNEVKGWLRFLFFYILKTIKSSADAMVLETKKSFPI